MHSTPADCSTTAPMDEELDRARSAGLYAVAGAATLDELRAVETDVLGKRGALARIKTGLGALPVEERATPAQARERSPRRAWRRSRPPRRAWPAPSAAAAAAAERLDLTEVSAARRGHAHLVTQASDASRTSSSASASSRRGPRGRDRLAQLRGAQHGAGHPARAM